MHLDFSEVFHLLSVVQYDGVGMLSDLSDIEATQLCFNDASS